MAAKAETSEPRQAPLVFSHCTATDTRQMLLHFHADALTPPSCAVQPFAQHCSAGWYAL